MSSKKTEFCYNCGSELKFDANIFNGVKLSVIIPVYNEINTLEQILEKVKGVQLSKEIIIVDDFSTDGTRELLQKIAEQNKSNEPFNNSIKVFFHEKNQGKGAALRTAFKAIAGNMAIIQDADMEYDPNDYYQLVFPLVTDRADVVYGSRFLGGAAHRVLYFWHSLGNRFITFTSNMFTNLNLTDIETCYKVFRADIIRKINIDQNRFGFEVEITSKIAKLRCRVYEVGISYFGRTYNEGKKITWKDGIQAMYLILKYH
ncbi:MAG: glycosyltransferase family 2 protein [Calditrichaceae bacterium]|nr:glycosyltransferase family 2 protein [Calditrichaceae bacterium]MBN2710251.1 glycosyltransferase family 2 protein [Calditrichaceae bacterium]RQV93874.1 MAG: glycosyltransferase family 2 protein [Calditrichota bacterium]